ncbi:hypothetical protein V2J09_019238 [Rumex salicifolius]
MAKKKANSRAVQRKDEDEEEDRHVVEVEEGESSEVAFAGKKKSKKKKGSGFSKASFELLDDEGSDKNDEVESENDIPAVSKKGGDVGSNKSRFEFFDNDDEEDAQSEDNEGGGESSKVAFAGKKKSKKKKGSGISKVSFELLDDEGNDEDDEVESENDITVVSKRRGDVGSSKSGFGLLGDDEDEDAQSEDDEGGGAGATKSSFQLLEDEDNEGEDARSEEDIVASVSTGKKSAKKKKGASGFSSSNFDLLGEDEDEEADSSLTEVRSGKDRSESENGDSDAPISFSGKKKKSKSGKKISEGDPSMQEEDDTSIKFSGKKKPSKKKNSTTSAASGDVDEADPNNSSVSTDGAVEVREVKKDNVPMATSKNKKKKKKGERSAKDEDELDKILAALGEGPSTSVPVPPTASTQEVRVVMQPEPVGNDETAAEKEAEEDGVVESAAAKKKKKKKEKEKEKKAAASAASAVEVKEEKPEEKKTKVDDKKVPKKVREMREAIARRQEAEERKKREEEEKLKKEEEERRKQEELEQQAEEARRRKKEREKEKLLKKRQEGKLLTAKQKEEQRRLEAIRNQFLSGKEVSLPADSGAPAKRPIYSTKKSKGQQAQTNGAAPSKTETVEEEETKVQDTESVAIDEVNQVDEVIEEERDKTPAVVVEKVEEDDDDDEWDAKSWDDADLALKKDSFEDEEVDSEPEPVMKKEVKKSVQLEPKVVSNNTHTSEKKQKLTDVAPPEMKREKSTSALQSEQSEFSLRSPICCIMGHVDTGKTKLLDCIRGTNVQEGEAGGITQQIGATYFPAENIRERTKELKADAKLKVPGLLVIDTPGHESFTNLRSRGSGLCDIAILVVDIMHGLEPQTIESLNLLKMRNTEFIIALNKVDRLYGWKTVRNAPIVKAMKQQTKDVQNEFNHRLIGIITQFKEQGLNTELYYKNKEMGETFSIVPTSAISGEGIPDMLLLLVQWTQKTMIEKLTYSDEVQCTVLEVKVIEGHGTTIDVILVNGVLHEGDQIVGPIVTSIRALLTPHPMKELRIKGSYVHHKEIKAAQGIKITAQGLEHAIAGTSLHVVGPDDDIEDIKATANAEMQSVMTRIDKSGEGVCVQASTLGSLEALLEFLKTPAVNIPVSGIGIGPVHKKDVMRAGVMLEKKKEYATILAFDVKVTPEAREYADEVGVKIFIADIIYHLFDQFKAYLQNLKEEQKKEAADEAVFPCVLQILPNCVFNKKDPIVLGVDVLEGIAKVGTPICVPSRDFICIGRIASIENNHKPVELAKKGQKIAIKILGNNPEEQQKMFGRHFEEEDELVSQISRKSIDILKANYREELSLEDWKLVVKLKTLFKIQIREDDRYKKSAMHRVTTGKTLLGDFSPLLLCGINSSRVMGAGVEQKDGSVWCILKLDNSKVSKHFHQ